MLSCPLSFSPYESVSFLFFKYSGDTLTLGPPPQLLLLEGADFWIANFLPSFQSLFNCPLFLQAPLTIVFKMAPLLSLWPNSWSFFSWAPRPLSWYHVIHSTTLFIIVIIVWLQQGMCFHLFGLRHVSSKKNSAWYLTDSKQVSLTERSLLIHSKGIHWISTLYSALCWMPGENEEKSRCGFCSQTA